MRNLIIVLGDQLDAHSAAFDGFDPAQDAVLQMEVRHEAEYVAQHRKRIAFFFAGMRHFRDDLRAMGRTVHYSELEDRENTQSFEGEVRRWFGTLKPEALIVLEPGDWRVSKLLRGLGLPLELREDRHFLCSHGEFDHFADTHRGLVMENFYRFMRKKLGILMEPDGTPTGGAWNFDHDNRESLRGKKIVIPQPVTFPPDKITQDVLAMVERAFPDSPGHLRDFDLPVSRADSLAVLDDFVRHRLPLFGQYQDAMRGGEWLLFHSATSGPLNLHMLTPREIVDAVLGNPAGAPLNAIEGFVRQVIGWREFIRGMYWRLMPDYAEKNTQAATLPMPRFYWTGETDMRCMSQAVGHTIDHAYTHHIERLMVLGLFALLLGVAPYEVHNWHMSMFWDSIDWVSLPNTLGMSQHGDGGMIGTKPYVASGNYIDRMSDHCRMCRYNPKLAVGEDACPFTTLYWDYLDRHRKKFATNFRMSQQYINLNRKSEDDVAAIRRQAAEVKARVTTQV